MGKKNVYLMQKFKRKSKKTLQKLTSQEIVRRANEVKDPLAEFPDYHIYERGNLRIHLKFSNVKDIEEETFQKIFNLEKLNMECMYNDCSWKWEEEKKYKEMTEKTAKYLIAMNEINELVGFSHFRFDMDFGNEVLYCYELQLDSQARKKGLGKFFLEILESIAFKNNMRKVILTVLKHNPNAVNFFYSQGYKIDETNPEGGFETIPYLILSKYNEKLTA